MRNVYQMWYSTPVARVFGTAPFVLGMFAFAPSHASAQQPQAPAAQRQPAATPAAASEPLTDAEKSTCKSVIPFFEALLPNAMARRFRDDAWTGAQMTIAMKSPAPKTAQGSAAGGKGQSPQMGVTFNGKKLTLDNGKECPNKEVL